MTEQEWLTSTTLPPMLEQLWAETRWRKTWLFHAACCRRIAPWFPDDHARSLPDLVEQLADGKIGNTDWARAYEQIVDPYIGNERARDGAGNLTFGAIMHLPGSSERDTQRIAGACIEVAGFLSCGGVAPREGDRVTLDRLNKAMTAEEFSLCDLLRCVIRNPFAPVAFDPAWRTSTVLDLARGIYADRAFDRLPILADALMDAGCGSDSAVSHCRSHPTHARGCWVVDSILGKS